MKNTYMIPETKVVKVELQHIMAGSLNLDGNGGTYTLPGPDDEDGNADSGSDGWSRRRGNVWDED